MGKYFDLIVMMLDQADMTYQADPKKNIAFFEISGKQTRANVVMVAKENLEIVICYSIFPDKYPEEKRDLVSEYVARANYGLNSGNFELDFNDGEIRYKTSADYEGLTGDMMGSLKRLLAVNFSTYERYYPGFMKLLWGDDDPKRLISEIEEK